jgi:Putative auto-transporter adhesin, head GIN domain
MLSEKFWLISATLRPWHSSLVLLLTQLNKVTMSRHQFSILFFLLFNTFVNAQSKNLSAFTAISTSGSVQVELVKGKAQKADYTIIKGNEDDLFIDVKNNELTVKIKSKNGMWNRSETKAKVTVYYNGTLKGIDCSAGSSLTSDSEISTSDMDIEVSSGANCSILLKSEDVNVSASSGAKVSINGTGNMAVYDASSGSKIDAGNFIASKANADVSSGASISLHATKKLTADASSGGSIKYKGNPESTNIDSGMSGSIRSY